MNDDGLLKMSELAEASGVSAGTIKHYLREGLLGGDDEIVRTSRNMAYYPPSFVERVQLIKRLQEERYMPLRAIRELLGSERPERLRALVEVEDRILERAAADDAERLSLEEAERRYDVPAKVLRRMEEIETLTPDGDGYDSEDVRIIEALSRFRAGGYEESIGFTVYDTIRYREALAPLVAEEVSELIARLAGEVEVERALEILASGAEPLRDLVGAMHAKLLREEIRRVLAERRSPAD